MFKNKSEKLLKNRNLFYVRLLIKWVIYLEREQYNHSYDI